MVIAVIIHETTIYLLNIQDLDLTPNQREYHLVDITQILVNFIHWLACMANTDDILRILLEFRFKTNVCPGKGFNAENLYLSFAISICHICNV